MYCNSAGYYPPDTLAMHLLPQLCYIFVVTLNIYIYIYIYIYVVTLNVNFSILLCRLLKD